MQQISGSGQGFFSSLMLFLMRLWRFIALSLLAIVALILGAAAFLIIIVPLIIYLLITKRKFINVMRSSTSRFNNKSSAQTFKNFSSQQAPPFQSQEEEVDIDIPAKKD
ncbi:hypothetical protein PQO01_21385 [Lentisphaera marina]|uniref:hypothetical protein n=1 Tax=Lentisphaera marina TaxID=1111041 RepID=UPI002367129D|nr:hypothetical protein [Lentisphaera marina]MDD7987515.1 hypothetical protein [Lentisphaera marina]